MTEVIQILAWPVATLAIVVVLRRPLGDLILSVKTLRYRHIEAEFGEAIKKAEKEAGKLLPGGGAGGRAAGSTSAAAQTIEIALRDLAASSPGTAVVEAWRGVARRRGLRPRRLASRGVAIDGDHPTPYKQIQEALVKRGILDEPRARLFHELRLMRNKVVHAPAYAISTEQAMQYVDLAAVLREFLRQA